MENDIYKLKAELRNQGRCPICTFKPPCSHCKDTRSIPKATIAHRAEPKTDKLFGLRVRIRHSVTPSRKVEVKTGTEMLQTIKRFKETRRNREITGESLSKERSKSWQFDLKNREFLKRFRMIEMSKLCRGLVGEALTPCKVYNL